MTVTAVNSLAGAKKLETIIIPASVTVSLHVSDAPVLKKIVINKNNRKYKVKNNMVVDKKVTTLYSCPGGLTGVKIPSTIKKVYYKAFYKGDIKKITIPKNVTTIGEEAFSECTKLQKVTFNKKLKYVKSKAFYGCKSLKSITFPDSVKEMGLEVFKNCTKLTSFKPGKKMNVIERCFEGCKSLKEIRLPKSVEYVSGWMFYDCKTLKKIYVYNKECDIYFNKKGKEWNGIPKRVTIYGYKGSTAEKYAKKNGNKFVAL